MNQQAATPGSTLGQVAGPGHVKFPGTLRFGFTGIHAGVGRTVDDQVGVDFLDRFFDVGPAGDIQRLTVQGGDLVGLAEHALTIVTQLSPRAADYYFHGYSP
jgi:hypothetical protein